MLTSTTSRITVLKDHCINMNITCLTLIIDAVMFTSYMLPLSTTFVQLYTSIYHL